MIGFINTLTTMIVLQIICPQHKNKKKAKYNVIVSLISLKEISPLIETNFNFPADYDWPSD